MFTAFPPSSVTRSGPVFKSRPLSGEVSRWTKFKGYRPSFLSSETSLSSSSSSSFSWSSASSKSNEATTPASSEDDLKMHENPAPGRVGLHILVPRITSASELQSQGRWACPVSVPVHSLPRRIAEVLTNEGIQARAATGMPTSPSPLSGQWEVQRTPASCEPGENETWHGIVVQSPPLSGDAQELSGVGDMCAALASKFHVRLDDLRCLVDVEVADLWAVKRLMVLLWFVEPLLLRLGPLRGAFLPLATHSTAASLRPSPASSVRRILPAMTRAETADQLQLIWDAADVETLRTLVSLPDHGDMESLYITSERCVTFKHLPSTLDANLVPRWVQLCVWIAKTADRPGEFPNLLGRIRRSSSYGPMDLITDLGGASDEVFRFWTTPDAVDH